jgi:hypothetical protein
MEVLRGKKSEPGQVVIASRVLQIAEAAGSTTYMSGVILPNKVAMKRR